MYFVRCATLTHHSGRHNAQTNHDKWALSANTDNWHTNSRTLNTEHQARYSSTDNCVQRSHGNVCPFSPYHQSWSYACIIWDAVLIKYWTAIALAQRHICRYVVWLHSFSKNQNKSVILKQTSQTLTNLLLTRPVQQQRWSWWQVLHVLMTRVVYIDVLTQVILYIFTNFTVQLDCLNYMCDWSTIVYQPYPTVKHA